MVSLKARPSCGGFRQLEVRRANPLAAGWLNILGQLAGTASSEYGAAQMLLAAVAIGSDFTYVPIQGHVIGVMAALTIFHAAINTAPTAWLNSLAKSYAVIHIGVLVAVCITLLVMQKDKHTAEYVFTNVEPSSGWTPPGFSFLFGFLSVAWTMTGRLSASVSRAELHRI